MANEVLEKIEMTEDQARDIVAHIVTQRIRWGKQWDASEIGLPKLTDALVLLAYADNAEAAELRKSLATANRQVGAANAREARNRSQIEDLKKENQLLLDKVDNLLAEQGLEGGS
jgi:hypothetical protein